MNSIVLIDTPSLMDRENSSQKNASESEITMMENSFSAEEQVVQALKTGVGRQILSSQAEKHFELEVTDARYGSIIIQLSPKGGNSLQKLKQSCATGNIKDFLPNIFMGSGVENTLGEGAFRWKVSIYVTPYRHGGSSNKVDAIKIHWKLLVEEMNPWTLLADLQAKGLLGKDEEDEMLKLDSRKDRMKFLLTRLLASKEPDLIFEVLLEHCQEHNEYVYQRILEIEGLPDFYEHEELSAMADKTSETERESQSDQGMIYSTILILRIRRKQSLPTAIHPGSDSEFEICHLDILEPVCYFDFGELHKEEEDADDLQNEVVMVLEQVQDPLTDQASVGKAEAHKEEGDAADLQNEIAMVLKQVQEPLTDQASVGKETPGSAGGFGSRFGSNIPAPTAGPFRQNTSSSTVTGMFRGGQQTNTFGGSQNIGFETTGSAGGFGTTRFGSNIPAPTMGPFGQNTSSSTVTGMFEGGQQTNTFGESQNTSFDCCDCQRTRAQICKHFALLMEEMDKYCINKVADALYNVWHAYERIVDSSQPRRNCTDLLLQRDGHLSFFAERINKTDISPEEMHDPDDQSPDPENDETFVKQREGDVCSRNKVMARIKNENFVIALEPETASIFCRPLPVEKMVEGRGMASFKPGSKYMVLDARGGTVITVHKVMTGGKLKEIHKASGGAWGGTQVDEAFKQFVVSLVGNSVFSSFQTESKEDYLDMLRDFEIKKRDTAPGNDRKVTFRLPSCLKEIFEQETNEDLRNAIKQTRYADKVSLTSDKLRLDDSIMKSFFSNVIQNIVSRVEELLKAIGVQGVSSILMVGGFSESKMLKDAIMSGFPNVKVIMPQEAGLVVQKGAVFFSHSLTTIALRVCRYTYGIERGKLFNEKIHDTGMKIQCANGLCCKDILQKYVEIGQTVSLNETVYVQGYYPCDEDQTSLQFEISASTRKSPMYITDEGCMKLGSVSVEGMKCPCFFDLWWHQN